MQESGAPRSAQERLQQLRQRLRGHDSDAAIKIQREDELPSNESSSIHSMLRDDNRPRFDVNTRKLRIFKSKPTCLLGPPSPSDTEKASENTNSNLEAFGQSRPISLREYNSNKSFRTATSEIDSDVEIMERIARQPPHQEPTFGEIVIQRDSIRDLVDEGVLARHQEQQEKSEIKESFFEEESSSFDLLRGGLDQEALLSLESATHPTPDPLCKMEQLSPDSLGNFNPVNDSSSFAVTIEGTYEEVKQCLKNEGGAAPPPMGGMEIINEEKEEIDESSMLARSRQAARSSGKKRGLGSTIKDIKQSGGEPSFGTFGKRGMESGRTPPRALNSQETPQLATKEAIALSSGRLDPDLPGGGEFLARLEMEGGLGSQDLYFSPWSSKRNTHELTFSGSIKRKMEDAAAPAQAQPEIGSESFLSTIRGSNNELSMTDESRTLRFLKSENAPGSPGGPQRHTSEVNTRGTLASNNPVGSNPLTARQEHESIASSQMPVELNDILRKRRNSSHFKGSAYSTEGNYTLLSSASQQQQHPKAPVSFADGRGCFVQGEGLLAQYEKLEKEKFQLERRVVEQEVELERRGQELTDLRATSSADFAALRDKYDGELVALQQDLEEQNDSAQEKISELEAAHERKVERMRALHLEEMERLQEELDSQHAAHAAALKERIAELNREMEREKCVQKARERFEERQVKNETFETERALTLDREQIRLEFQRKMEVEVRAAEERARTLHEFEIVQISEKHQRALENGEQKLQAERAVESARQAESFEQRVAAESERLRMEYMKDLQQRVQETHEQTAASVREQGALERKAQVESMRIEYEEKIGKLKREVEVLRKENSRMQRSASRKFSRQSLMLTGGSVRTEEDREERERESMKENLGETKKNNLLMTGKMKSLGKKLLLR